MLLLLLLVIVLLQLVLLVLVLLLMELLVLVLVPKPASAAHRLIKTVCKPKAYSANNTGVKEPRVPSRQSVIGLKEGHKCTASPDCSAVHASHNSTSRGTTRT